MWRHGLTRTNYLVKRSISTSMVPVLECWCFMIKTNYIILQFVSVHFQYVCSASFKTSLRVGLLQAIKNWRWERPRNEAIAIKVITISVLVYSLWVRSAQSPFQLTVCLDHGPVVQVMCTLLYMCGFQAC